MLWFQSCDKCKLYQKGKFGQEEQGIISLRPIFNYEVDLLFGRRKNEAIPFIHNFITKLKASNPSIA
jgi:hypothetical protein